MRSVEGKAEGLEAVVMVLLEESLKIYVSMMVLRICFPFAFAFVILWNREDL